jgi:hypothetical protein
VPGALPQSRMQYRPAGSHTDLRTVTSPSPCTVCGATLYLAVCWSIRDAWAHSSVTGHSHFYQHGATTGHTGAGIWLITRNLPPQHGGFGVPGFHACFTRSGFIRSNMPHLLCVSSVPARLPAKASAELCADSYQQATTAHARALLKEPVCFTPTDPRKGKSGLPTTWGRLLQAQGLADRQTVDTPWLLGG